MTRIPIALLAWMSVCLGSHLALAQQDIVRIEEDWQLLVTQPDEQLDAPQVTMTMAPFASDADLLLQVDLNYASIPSFSKGGFQIRACRDDHCLAEVRLLADERLHHDEELIQWTQVVQPMSQGFYFGIVNGTSTSWGTFGGSGAFVYVNYGDVQGNFSLGSYDPQDSCDNSGVTYAGNRVGYLRLKKVRLYSSLGQVQEWVFNHDLL